MDQHPQRPGGQLRVNAVAHPDPVAPGQHQAHLAQHGKMARDLGLGRIQGPMQVADAALVRLQQQGQDPTPDRVSQGLEEGLLAGQRRCLCRHAGAQRLHSRQPQRQGSAASALAVTPTTGAGIRGSIAAA